MKVFVTGGTGGIGGHAVPALVGKGHTVTALARTPEKAAMLAKHGAEPVSVSIFDRAALTAAFSGHEAVVNLTSAIPPMNRFMDTQAWRDNDRVRTRLSRHRGRCDRRRRRTRSAGIGEHALPPTVARSGSTKTCRPTATRWLVRTWPRSRTPNGSRMLVERGSCFASAGSTGQAPPIASSSWPLPVVTSVSRWVDPTATYRRSTWPTGAQLSPRHCRLRRARSTLSMTSH
jgi:type II secretory pathway pseudopilin PulG